MAVNRWYWPSLLGNLMCALNATRALMETQGPWWVVLILALGGALNYAMTAFLWSLRK